MILYLIHCFRWNLFVLDVEYKFCISRIIHQQVSGYKVEEKLHLGYANKEVKYHWYRLSMTIIYRHSATQQNAMNKVNICC
jgi:hypothetical protein